MFDKRKGVTAVGILPKRCEPFQLPQRQVLFVAYLLLSDAARAESAAGRSMDRSPDGFAIEVALRVFNRFITMPTPPSSAKSLSRDVTPKQAKVVRALRLTVEFAAAGFKRWWERDELNRQFGWHTEGFIGRKLFLAKELLTWAFPNCDLPDPILSEAGEQELLKIDAEMKYSHVQVNWNGEGIRPNRRKKPRRKET